MYQFTEKKTAKKVLVAANVSRLGAGGVGEAFLIFCNKSKTNSLIFKQQKAPLEPRRCYAALGIVVGAANLVKEALEA